VYLAWRDAAAGLGGNHRIGNEVNRSTANLWCGVYREDGTRFRGNGEQLELRRLDRPGLVAGPQRLFHDGQRLRFALDAEGCRIDFEIDDEGPAPTRATGAAFEGSKGSAGQIFADNFHTFCRVRGTVVLDGRPTDVDAPAWRDHSWGVRRWDSFVSSRSFGGGLGALRFRYGSMVSADGSFFRRGSMEVDGETVEVLDAAMLLHLDDDSMRCAGAEVRYHLASGQTRTITIRTIGGMIGATGQRYGWESVGDVSVDGESGGWGFLEANINPRNGHDAPAFALGDALTNGVTRGT
jgi:hypothetical protein